MKFGGDPVRLFASEYQRKFSSAVSCFIDDAVRRSGIDLEVNRRLTDEIRQLTSERDENQGHKQGWTVPMILLILGFLGWGGWIWFSANEDCPVSGRHLFFFIFYSCLSAVFIIFLCIPRIRKYHALIRKLEQAMAEKTDEARQLLLPFYGFFDWNTVTKLIEQVVPDLRFDEYLGESRLADLARNFGLPGDLLSEKSVIYTHSGCFHGYPFVFLEAKEFFWGKETYYGSKTIHWSERERGVDGKYHTVHRSETLTASVTKPKPCFQNRKYFLFGHDAAPHLCFSRSPSSLSGEKESFFNHLGRKFAMNRLKALEENLTDDSDYTMVGNHEFELLFHAVNRNHEVEFRLLFTPLAQQQMVNLLNDTEIGYGDDFHCQKEESLVTMASEHLDRTEFSTEPEALPEFDFRNVRQAIQIRYEEFFRSVYFTFAPLMTIPLYNQPRTEILVNGAPGNISEELSSWELESIANYQGEKHYQHARCITDSLLKVEGLERIGSQVRASVTAYGFKGRARTEYESVYGGDGRFHRVRVDWTEYQQVQKTSALRAHPVAGREELKDGEIYRRSTASCLPGR